METGFGDTHSQTEFGVGCEGLGSRVGREMGESFIFELEGKKFIMVVGEKKQMRASCPFVHRALEVDAKPRSSNRPLFYSTLV